MREILFRGKTISGFWVEGLLSRIRDDWYISNSADKPYAYHVRPETVCQFVSEAQNKKLFDGDILRSINHYEGKKPYYNYHIIQWSKKFHGWFAKNKSNLGKEDTNGDIQLFVYLKNCGDFEVTGSIHDHETA